MISAIILIFIGVVFTLFASNFRKIPYDIDKDGIVGQSDLDLLILKYGQECQNCREDINKDHIINNDDYILLIGHFGKKW